MAKQKSAVLRSPWLHLYHACEHITRKNRADSCTHCLHARYNGSAGVNLVCALTGYGDRLWHMVSTVWRGGKYAEKRRNILIIFIKCTIYDKSKDDRGCEAAIALQQSRGEMRHAPVSGSCRCVPVRRQRQSDTPQTCKKSSFLLYIGNVTTLLQAGYRYITKAKKALTRAAYMNKMEAYEYKHE